MTSTISHADVDELARSAAGGDAEAFATLYAKFQPLIESAAAKIRDRHDREDLEGELRIAFCKAINQFAAKSRTGHLPGLVKAAVDAGVARWFRFRSAKKRAGGFDVADDRDAPLRVASTRTPLQTLIDRETVELAFTRLIELAPQSRRLISYMKEGFSPAEACALVGMDPNEKQRAMDEIRRATRKPFRRAVQCMAAGDVIATYPSIAAASRASGVPITTIHAAMQQRGRVAGGYEWRYAPNDNGDDQ